MAYDFTIEELGKCSIKSPIALSKVPGDFVANYANDDTFIRFEVTTKLGKQESLDRKQVFEAAGPREFIYFSPQHVHAGIVSCGGLCPGINDVIRAIVRCLWYRYGVRRITGIRYGFKGFLPEYRFGTRELSPDVVDDIHKLGGTYLGSSRGGGRELPR